MLITRYCPIVSDTHSATTEVGDDESQSTGGDVEAGKDSYNYVVVNAVKRFAEINKACKDSCRVSVRVIKFLVDKVKQQDKVVVN